MILRNRKRIIASLAILPMFGLAGFGGSSWFFAVQFISPARAVIGPPPADFSYPVETVSFDTDDGISIKGWYTPSEDNSRAVILLHGYRSNRLQMLAEARMLRRAGYAVLLYDARATGESGGDQISVGYYETADLVAAVRFLRVRGAKNIACLGTSQGGATILLAAEKLDDVKCVIAVSSYDCVTNAIDRRYRHYFKMPGWLGGRLLLWVAERRLGLDADKVSPIQEIAKLRCPVFIIAGASDKKTWAEDTQRLYEAAREPKQLWLVEGAGHENLHTVMAEEYERRILEFLGRYLP